ncbi:hypothetical protein [Sediminibacillus massiliensis]|uniref:hypothetical protein n=1 Tax=Sediminibacillus massiliensis TaxID=1926277 RepID=UPI0009885A19|nr:hypothetical protein [Sediminibacillus massiliensis]
MNSAKLSFGVFLLFMVLIAVFSNDQTTERQEAYDGEELQLALIGDSPEIRNDRVEFEKISLEELRKLEYGTFDGVLIMEDQLSEAARQENRDIYKELQIPLFFVGSQANVMPFIDMESQISYEEYAQRVNDKQTFISGLWYPSGKE